MERAVILRGEGHRPFCLRGGETYDVSTYEPGHESGSFLRPGSAILVLAMNDCPICGSKIPTDLLGEPQLKPGQEFIRTYCDAFKARYGTNPQIIGVDAGIAKRLVKDLGLPKAKALVETYLGMTDAWFLERRHDLKTFANNLQKIVVALETGYNPSKKETHAMERRGTNINAFKRLLDESEP